MALLCPIGSAICVACLFLLTLSLGLGDNNNNCAVFFLQLAAEKGYICTFHQKVAKPLAQLEQGTAKPRPCVLVDLG